LKDKKEARVNKLMVELRQRLKKPRNPVKNDIKCYSFGETGHITRECRKPRNFKNFTQGKQYGGWVRIP
jgi:hypothetical protein